MVSRGRRVVITGLGVVAPCGIGIEAYWQGLHETAPVGCVRALEPFGSGAVGLPPKELRRTDRFTRLAYAAAEQALAQANVERAASGSVSEMVGERGGVVVGTGLGGLYAWEEATANFLNRPDARSVSAYAGVRAPVAAAAAFLSRRIGLRGPCRTLATACASATDAVAHAALLIASDRCDLMLAGGTEASATPTNQAVLERLGLLSAGGVARPFDRSRDGLVLAEGAGMLVLEEYSAARRRGATLLGEIVGAGATADAYHDTQPDPRGDSAAACMRLALRDAGMSAQDIVQVNAHGSATQAGDAAEAAAIAGVFGLRSPHASADPVDVGGGVSGRSGTGALRVTAIKGATGHAMAAAGALEAVAIALMFQHGRLPGVVGLGTSGFASLPLASTPEAWSPGPTLSNSFGFGGYNACLVLVPST